MKDKIIKNKDILDGILLSIISIFFIKESFKLHGNNQWALSPALFPLIVASLVLIFSIIQIIKSINNKNIVKEENMNKEKKMNKENIKKLILVILISFAYLLILPKLHFLISSILYLAIFMYILGERNLKILILVSIITPVLIQYVFGTILNVYLP